MSNGEVSRAIYSAERYGIDTKDMLLTYSIPMKNYILRYVESLDPSAIEDVENMEAILDETLVNEELDIAKTKLFSDLEEAIKKKRSNNKELYDETKKDVESTFVTDRDLRDISSLIKEYAVPVSRKPEIPSYYLRSMENEELNDIVDEYGLRNNIQYRGELSEREYLINIIENSNPDFYGRF